jgi:hypothetical protein
MLLEAVNMYLWKEPWHSRKIYEDNRDLFEHVSKYTGENITDIVNLGSQTLIFTY